MAHLNCVFRLGISAIYAGAIDNVRTVLSAVERGGWMRSAARAALYPGSVQRLRLSLSEQVKFVARSISVQRSLAG
jgi:hypothetical protein